MSTTIDEKVVQMRFDNKQFEEGVRTSMSTLDKLKRGLRLDGATKGLEEVDKTAKKVNMASLSNGVEAVRAKFSAMQVVAITALTNITNSAINAGRRIVSALTIDPIRQGFSEYETQINAVQTILANTKSKGTTLEDVNNALDTLNAYADKTIYNFTEMTRNIGTFTAAGVDLKTSVSAIQGIANLAAVSGSTSQQASTAMYQLSQALSSGTVKLMDWNSVVNAGMGGQVFQDALKATARIHGVAIDDLIKKEGSFRETLKHGWLTSEILTETLENFTLCAEKGTEKWEEYKKSLMEKGYTAAQAEEILEMGKTATEAATKVKTFTQLFDTLKEAAQSGWTQTWEILVGDFEEAKELLTQISNVVGDFINKTSEARNKMLKGWKDLDGRQVLIDAITNAFKGLVAIAKPISEVFREIFPRTTAEQLFAITERLKEATNSFKEWAESSETVDKIKRTFKGLFALLDIGVQAIKAAVGGIMNLIGYMGPAGEGLLEFTAKLGDLIVKFRDFLKTSDIFNKFCKKISTVFGSIIKGVTSFVKSIANAIKEIANVDTSGVDKLTDKVKRRFEPFTKLGEGLKAIFSAIAKAVKKAAPVIFTLVGKIGDAFGKLGEKLSTAIGNADFDAVFDIINGILSGGILLAIKKLIDSFSEVGGLFEGLGDVLEGFTAKLKAEALIKIATAIAVLTASLLVLSLIDSNKLTAAIGAITGIFIDLIAAMSMMNKLSGKGKGGIGEIFNSISLKIKSNALIDVSKAIAIFAASILILSASMSMLGKLETKELIKGMVSIAALVTMMVATSKILSKESGKMTKGMTGLVIMAVAIRVLAKAIEQLGALGIDTLVKGLASTMILIYAMTATSKILSKESGKMAKGMTGLVIMAAAILILAKAIETMGNFSWEQIGKGLLTMAAGLGVVIAALHLLPKGLLSKSTGIVIIASALVILGSALSKMGGMSWSEVAIALVTLAGSLAIIAGAMYLMTSAIPGAIAMAIIAPSLLIFAAALKVLGGMSWEEIGKSLLMLAGIFTIVGVAGLVLGPVVPIILALSGAIALLGVGCVAAGVGVLAFAAGLTALAASGSAVAGSLVVIVSAILGLIPLILRKVGEGIIEILKLIAGSIDAICAAITTVLLAIIEALIACIPPLIECLGVLLDSLLNFIVEYIPKIVVAGMKLILGLLKGIADNIDEVIATAIEVVVNFINGIASKIPDVIQSGVNLILSFINGIANAIRNNTKPMIDAVNNLMDSVFEAIKAWVKNAVTSGGDLIAGLIDGIKGAASDLWTSMVGVVEDAWNGVKDFFGIHSPSTVAAEAGMFIDQGLANGLTKFSKVVGKSATGVGKTAMNSLSKAVSGISDTIADDMNMSPTIRPVIDLTDVQNGEKQLNSMFNKNHTISIDSATIRASSISSGMSSRTESSTKSTHNQQGTSFSFTQNNYSPKALSKVDIYRQTKNQFSTMKGALVGQ